MGKLEGWKAIAAALNRSEKTARECARTGGLPVEVFRNRVAIDAAELETWRRKNTRLFSDSCESSEAA